MKPLSIKLSAVLVIGLIMTGYAEVWGADWKLYSRTDLGDYYYDAESLTRPSKNVVRLWTELFHSEEGKTQSMKVVGIEFGMSVALQEIDCANNMSRLLRITHYDNDGMIIYSESLAEPKWNYIIPESMADILYKTICK